MSKLYDLLSAMCGKIKKPDWNQNDPTATDYVKNRPFWTGDPAETVLFGEITHEWTGSGYGSALELDPFDIVAGDEYVVTFDGVKYNCIAYIVSGPNAPSIGNSAIVTGGDGDANGEPFFIMNYRDAVWIAVNESAVGTHTVSLSKLAPIVHKIDPKYLPSGVPFVDVPYVRPVVDAISIVEAIIGGASVVYNMEEGEWSTEHTDEKWGIFKTIHEKVTCTFTGLVYEGFVQFSMPSDNEAKFTIRNCIYSDNSKLYVCKYSISFETDGETITMFTEKYEVYTCTLTAVT